MIKKLISLLMLILFTASSSGVGVFAFECSELEHLHYSIFHKVTCADFEELDDEHNHSNNDDDCCCGCEDKEEGTHYFKVLSLGIDLDIVKKIIEKISITKHFIPNNFLTNYKNNNQLLLNNYYIQKANQFTDFSLQIVKYIRTITSKTSEEPLI